VSSKPLITLRNSHIIIGIAVPVAEANQKIKIYTERIEE
jgi:hypothetical protein